MKIKITTDSTCDLGNELAERYDIDVIPLSVILGDSAEYKDGVDITPQDIFDFVKKTGTLPKTCAITIEEYVAFFERELTENDIVIHFNISSKASSSNSNAVIAAEQFGGRVHAIDTLALSTGQGLLVLKACEMARSGATDAEIVRTVNELRPKVNTSFVPDALDYLHKGGRCSLASMLGAKILKLHPMIKMRDGQLYAAKKYMGDIDKCLKNYITELAKEYPKYDKSRCFITHSQCEPETVKKVREIVAEKFEFDEIIETIAGCVVTSHCGRGTLGVLFITE